MHSRIGMDIALDTQIISTTLPAKLVHIIDIATKKTLDSRAMWMRRACFEKAERDGLIKQAGRDAHAAAALDEVMG